MDAVCQFMLILKCLVFFCINNNGVCRQGWAVCLAHNVCYCVDTLLFVYCVVILKLVVLGLGGWGIFYVFWFCDFCFFLISIDLLIFRACFLLSFHSQASNGALPLLSHLPFPAVGLLQGFHLCSGTFLSLCLWILQRPVSQSTMSHVLNVLRWHLGCEALFLGDNFDLLSVIQGVWCFSSSPQNPPCCHLLSLGWALELALLCAGIDFPTYTCESML